MTIKELMNAVTALGFTEQLENGESFRYTLERALDVLFCDKVMLSTVRYKKVNPTLTRLIKEYKHKQGESEAYKLCGRAYSFTTHGIGYYTVFHDGKSDRVSFSGTTHHRALIDGEYVTLVFYGDNVFDVENICVFGDRLSDNRSDVPLYSELTTINLRRELEDFYSLWGPIKLDTGEELFCESIGDKITLTTPDTRALHITYRRHAPATKHLTEDSELELPDGGEELLPFLCAALYFLDDEPERAQYYMALYKDMLAATVTKGDSAGYEKYKTDGWA